MVAELIYSNNKSIYEEMIVISISAVPPFHCSMCDRLVIDLWAAYVCCVCLHESNNKFEKKSIRWKRKALFVKPLLGISYVALDVQSKQHTRKFMFYKSFYDWFERQALNFPSNEKVKQNRNKHIQWRRKKPYALNEIESL